MEQEITIYALKNPLDGVVFYVGQTFNLNLRIKQHIYNAKNNSDGNTEKNDIILNVVNSGKELDVEVLEKLNLVYSENIDFVNEREGFWIEKYKDTITNKISANGDNVICLNCGHKLPPYKGRRHRTFCSDKCKLKYWQQHNKKSAKYVQYSKYKELLDKYNAVTEERNNPLINAARGRDECGVNLDEIRPSKPKDNKTQGKEEKQAKNGTEKPNKANMVEVKPFSFADYLKQNK